ncbi:putative ATP-dependent endonuclease of the OLD family [Methanolobus vulcani]|uniref:Putative ATP-dependent endonuclease of the OLD family n=1 Tax=Methanolobus vulcani TaxID=38026 RepID=A0A7Z7AX19_9EURY|nr:AAA family ATPase [Methanolobus vulcani]SDF93495.1 putative ATP-dependent endonuclease of the OLD family [Methanolobus vulcani]
MSIRIDFVRISGFRGLSNVEISLPKFTLLIGANNSGKTSVIKALQLALGDYLRFLTDDDFHIEENGEQWDEIIVDLRIIAADSLGKRIGNFSDEWLGEFGDKIQSEADGNQFVAIRSVVGHDKIKGGYFIERYSLQKWPEFNKWKEETVIRNRKITGRLEAIPFISIEAQRDIHNELKEKSSFIGRVLSSVEYDDDDIKKLEEMLAEINKKATDKSEQLKVLKNHLNKLNNSFEGNGHTELTPFPKKVRDLSKRFSVHFGDTDAHSFSMEYHGMGTRSWASMLTVMAFSELRAENHEKEAEPFFPILAAEEPESHLHPNAQRTLYRQLLETNGQVIISSHSPYLAAMANIYNLRRMVKCVSNVEVSSMMDGLDNEDINILQREIMRFRGELLFAKAVILVEGVTEEQLIPAMFETWCGYKPFSVGVNCISVAGKNYTPFIKMACSFGIPVFIVSDNDGRTKTDIEAQISKIKTRTCLTLEPDIFSVSYLRSGNDIEAELLNVQGLRAEIIEALVLTETRGTDNSSFIEAKKMEINSFTDSDILNKMRKSKASYAGFLADVIARNPNNKSKEELVPQAVQEAFEQIKGWISQ